LPLSAVKTRADSWFRDELERILLTVPDAAGVQRHELHPGFDTERENLVTDAKENNKGQTP
jgi:hypothetical protein